MATQEKYKNMNEALREVFYNNKNVEVFETPNKYIYRAVATEMGVLILVPFSGAVFAEHFLSRMIYHGGLF